MSEETLLTPKFAPKFWKAAKALLAKKAVKEPLFSRGTYQVEVQEKKKKWFPFLHIQETGEVADCFCSCPISEAGEGCPHLAAAYLKIFNGFALPLHERFRKSFWNRLCQMAARRQDYASDCFQKNQEGVFLCTSKTKKKLVSIFPKTVAAKKKWDAILKGTGEETEETSLKFSNRTSEEIAALRANRGSHSLRYELSFWSDLAKWMISFCEDNVSYKIAYEGTPLPQAVTIDFPALKAWFYISEASWPWLIPSLATIQSPLKVYDAGAEMIEEVFYDPKAKCLHVKKKQGSDNVVQANAGYSVGDWLFVEGKGFFRQANALIFQKETIGFDEIAEALSQSYKELQRYLPIHSDPVEVHYQLYFDDQDALHIGCYLFEIGDLTQENSCCFIPWVYLEGKGFYRVENWLFEGVEKIIPKREMADFINKHRLWLHQFPGFQTHLGSLESHLIYRLSEEGVLSFEAELSFPEGYEHALHFDEWVYVPSFGFYMKKESSGRLPLHPGLQIAKEEIPSFIASHKEELGQVQGFFSAESLVQRTGLKIALNAEEKIVISPVREYAEGIDPNKIRVFGDYLFLSGKGFSEVPPASRLPDRFREETVIGSSQEAAFLTYELEPLKPYVVEMDPGLKKPVSMSLRIRKIRKEVSEKGQEWWVDLVYDSELGTIDPFSIWDAFQEKKKYLFSSAGLLHLKEPRFQWIRHLSKAKLNRRRSLIHLSTIEWIRLSAFEEIERPRGDDPESETTRHLLQELEEMKSERPFNLSSLQAKLRPYQEHGVGWLWFLYCHGLSGLLCDDMGLGKTHQAMGLLAAVSCETQGRKFLVVCPTSVIYHWQALLQKFLPTLRVCVYYGLERTLEDFEENYDLLLTSYGILRTGKEDLRSHVFEVAIFDEVQIAKNHASQTHKALCALQTTMRLGLTGTPLENRLRELKSLFDVVLPGYMPQEAVFRDLFIYPIEKLADASKKALLNRLIRPFILRRKKSEVLTDLPEKIEEIAYCDLSDEQRGLYREIAEKTRSTVYRDLQDASKPVSYIHVFSALTALKRICDHPALFLGKASSYAEHSSGKWDLFIELMAEAKESGQKVVVFSQYLEMLAIIELYLKKKGIGFATIKGSTRDRGEPLKRFREDPDCMVFTASLLAAGVGIDLTVASIVIHYDRWWNPAKENQATDRVHRIGQNRGVQVFKLVTKDTIEEHIHDLIEKKKGLLEEVVGVEDQIHYLSREELVSVFDRMFNQN